jgi:hypothetical protein
MVPDPFSVTWMAPEPVLSMILDSRPLLVVRFCHHSIDSGPSAGSNPSGIET